MKSSLTQEEIQARLAEENEKILRAKKMMLWFGIISLVMSFAGLTSAYFVSKEREDWISDYPFPNAFVISLAVIILSSITYYLAKKFIQKGASRKAMIFLIATFLLGITFVYFQFKGFSEFIENGYYFTGSESTITTSFIYLIVWLHLAHIFAGLISLLVVIYNHYKQKYNAQNMLGVTLSATFWHFVDILWIYLFLFFYFVR
jgi:cytochrome c oxidase subunit 3